MHHRAAQRNTGEKTPSLMTTGQERWGNHDLPQFGIVESWVYFPYFISVHDIMERD
jgi:hypothetical protein